MKKEYKVFISLPFTGHEDTLGERYKDALRWMKEYGEQHPELDIKTIAQKNINKLIKDKKSVPDEKYPYYMGKDIQAILECDAILMCDDWEHSTGCNLEHRAAELFKKEIIYKQDSNTLV